MAFDPVYFSIACGAHFTGLSSPGGAGGSTVQLILQSTKRQGGQK